MLRECAITYVYFYQYYVSIRNKNGWTVGRCEIKRDSLITSIDDIAGIEEHISNEWKIKGKDYQIITQNFILLREEIVDAEK